MTLQSINTHNEFNCNWKKNFFNIFHSRWLNIFISKTYWLLNVSCLYALGHLYKSWISLLLISLYSKWLSTGYCKISIIYWINSHLTMFRNTITYTLDDVHFQSKEPANFAFIDRSVYEQKGIGFQKFLVNSVYSALSIVWANENGHR